MQIPDFDRLGPSKIKGPTVRGSGASAHSRSSSAARLVAPLHGTAHLREIAIKAGVWFALGCGGLCLLLDARAAEEGAPRPAYSAPVVHETERNSDIVALGNEAKELLARKAYDQIERRAEELRTSKAAYPDGYWRLGAFYSGLNMAKPGSWVGDAEQEAHIAALRAWVRERTNSVTARIALARSLSDRIYQDSSISWDRVKRGFEALLKRYPDSLDVASEFCYQACQARDAGTARRLLDEKVKDQVVLRTCRTPEVFEQVRRFFGAR